MIKTSIQIVSQSIVTRIFIVGTNLRLYMGRGTQLALAEAVGVHQRLFTAT
jgi:hypothetical protein